MTLIKILLSEQELSTLVHLTVLLNYAPYKNAFVEALTLNVPALRAVALMRSLRYGRVRTARPGRMGLASL